MQKVQIKGAHLSWQQRRLWLLGREQGTYRVRCAVRLIGVLDTVVFQRAIQQVVQQHEILRTVLHTLPGTDIPLQVVRRRVEVGCPFVDLEGLPFAEQERAGRACFAALQKKAFDLERGPWLHLFVLRFSAARHLLLVCMSAFSADAATLPSFISAFTAQYHALAVYGALQTEDVLQYIDVSAWQNELLESGDVAIAREFWLRIDLSRLAQMALPFEMERLNELRSAQFSPQESFAPILCIIPLEKAWPRQIFALSRKYGVSSQALLLTCWHLLLWKITGEAEPLIGVACDGRIHEELADLPGLYTRLVPVQLSGESNWSVQRAARVVHEALEDARRWQMYFTWPASQEHSFFPITYAYEAWPARLEHAELSGVLEQCSSYMEPFALHLTARQVGEDMQLELHYDSQWFTSTQIDRLAAALRVLLAHVLESHTGSIASLRLLSSGEQERLREFFCSRREKPDPYVLHQLFEAQASDSPDALAVLDAGGQWTYQELNQRSNQLARYLRGQGVGPGTLVGLFQQRAVEMIISLLAVWKAGGAYVPLDPEIPLTRLLYQLQDSGAPLLLTQQPLLSRIAEWPGKTLALDAIMAEIAQESCTDLPLCSDPRDLAYVIYTSGSTGQPKGVMIQHSSVLSYTRGLCERLEIQGRGWHCATVSTLAADLGNTAIFAALSSGGCLHVLDYATIVSGQHMTRWMSEHPIDVLKIVPSHLSALLNDSEAGSMLPQRALILGGEELSRELLRRIRQQQERVGNTCTIYNHYGPTETTVGVLLYRVPERTSVEEEKRVPIGRALPGSEIMILDEGGQIVPVGVIGELYLGGEGVALGYKGRSEQTAERFVPHPFSKEEGARLYRSGDLARYREEGTIEYVGRADQQVKIRGYRVEPGEIENALLGHANIRNVAVMLREDEPGQVQLVAYIVAREQPEPSLADVRAFLQDRLPFYMLPSAVVSLRALPLTANGKLDRKALPQPAAQHQDELAYVAPRSPIEEMLVNIWEEVLKVKPVGINHNFFQSGGHSLLATQIIARMQDAFHIEIPLRSIFDAPTIAALAEQVESLLRRGDGVEMPALVSVPRNEPLPLSFAQQRLWFLDQLAPGDTSYTIAHAIRASGSLHIRALLQALREIVRRHENLRTVFPRRDELPVQVINPPTLFWMHVYDLSSLTIEHRQATAQLLAGQEARTPFQLARGPLFRATLLQLDTQDHVLLLTMHHIVSDAWSRTLLVRELNALYNAFREERPSPLPELLVQYADYAVWQRRWLEGEVLNEQLRYWKEQLVGVAPLELPTDYPRPRILGSRGATQGRFLPLALTQELHKLSQQEDVTLFMTLLAAFQVLLSCYSGQDDILVGTPIANRNRAELEHLIGFFTNTLVMRADLSDNPSFRTLLTRTRHSALGAYTHQDLPFEYLVEALQPERDLGRAPLFQVMFVLQHAQPSASSSLRLAGTSLRPIGQAQTTSKFDLTLFVTHTPQGLRCTLEYSSELFTEDTIKRLLERWQLLLEALVACPDRSVHSFPLLTSADQQLLFVEWNKTGTDLSGATGLHRLFERQAEAVPDAVAVSMGEESLSYAALNRRSNQLARYLRYRGVGPDVVVGLCFERSLSMAIALLAVLKAGGAYLPLDPAYPGERLAYALQDARTALVLVQRREDNLWAGQMSDALKLDELWAHIEHEPCHNLDIAVSPDNLLYVIYTSGSTGVPKGVAMPHLALYNLCQWQQQHSCAGRGTRTLQFTSPGFDVASQELFATWSTGGHLCLISEETRRDPFALARVLQHEAIERLFLPFIALQQLTLAVEHLHAFPVHLTEVITAGEQLQITQPLRQLFIKLKDTALVNQYGPSESHVATAFELAVSPSSWSSLPPIGTPVANTQIYLLNRQLQPVPPGVVGELCIGGDCLARGYLHQPENTAEKFIPHPWSNRPGVRLYRTGDVARYQADGTLQFLGRNDHQVKIRGHRVEPGEIEVALSQHPAVRENAVIVEQRPGMQKQLIAYVVLARGTRLLSSELRRFLKARLPEPMIPSFFVQLQELPLTPSGKVDRRSLPAVDYGSGERTIIQPRDALEAQLQLIWCEVLGHENLGVTENFFDLGGHSILAVNLVARIQERLGYSVALSTLFQYATIADMTSILRQQKGVEQSTLVPLHARTLDTTRAPFFCVHPVGGTVFRYYWLARQLGADQPFYGLQAPDLDGSGRTFETIEALAEYYISLMQSVQPTGPYLLGGWSMGGVVAFEMAQQLHRQGQQVALLALIDSVAQNLSGPSAEIEEQGDSSDAALVREYMRYFGLSLEIDGFEQLTPEDQLLLIIDQLKHIGILPEDTDSAQARRIMRTNVVNMQAFRRYVPQVYPCGLTLFRAQEGVHEEQDTQEPMHPGRTTTRGWEKLTREGVEVHLIPGNHSTILDMPLVQHLATSLRKCIDDIL